MQTHLVDLKRKIDSSLVFSFYQFTLAIQVEAVVVVVVVVNLVSWQVEVLSVTGTQE